MTSAQTVLIEALAQADALWLPIRDPMANHWPAVWVLRWRFADQGVPYRGGGEKESERALTEAVRLGWLHRRRAQRKTVGVRLTRAGMAEGRRLIGEHPHADVIVLDECLRHGPPGIWLPEICFNEGRGWGDGNSKELHVVQAANLPALTSRLVESNCLHKGQVCYKTTGAPRPDVPAEELAADAPEPDPDAFDLYDRKFADATVWLQAQDNVSVGARGEIGELYLPPFCLIEYQALETSCLPAPELPRYNDGTLVPGWRLEGRRLVYDRAAAEAARRLARAALEGPEPTIPYVNGHTRHA